MDGQGTRWRRKIAENFNRLSRVHQRYKQTDRRAIAYSEREREFTFAKNALCSVGVLMYVVRGRKWTPKKVIARIYVCVTSRLRTWPYFCIINTRLFLAQTKIRTS